MATTIISTDNTASTTTLTTDSLDVVVNATLSFTQALVFSVNAGNASLVVNGNLIGTTGAGLVDNRTIQLVNNGTISGFVGISFSPSNNTLNTNDTLSVIVNHGTILAEGLGRAAIEDNLDGDNTGVATIQHILNDGTIVGDVGLKLGSKDSLTDNDGIIRGAKGIAIVAGEDNDTVRNTGLIDGAIQLANGVNELENGGVISGPVTTGTGTDTVNNSGRIGGDVDLGTGLNRLDNTGFIDGTLFGGSQVDFVRNFGTITGQVGLFAGGNTFLNAGTVFGSATGGTGDDAFDNRGTIQGGIDLGAGTNTLINSGYAGFTIAFAGGTDTFTNSGEVRGAIAMGDGTNTVTNDGLFAARITFGSGNDTLTNSGRMLVGADFAAGNDSLTNMGNIVGNLSMGGGDDFVLNSGVLFSGIDLGAGNDLFANIAGGTAGNVDAGAGDDQLFGNTLGTDAFFGGDGNDTLRGFAGDDVLFGEAGNDSLVGGQGADDMSGGSGNDVASYEAAARGVVASLLDAGANTGEAAGDGYTGIEGLVGSDFADALTGDAAANTLLGGKGDDVLDGNAGADRLEGEAGSDTYIIDNAADLIVESSANTGTDAVLATVSYALDAAAHIELIRANGIALALTGNGFAQLIEGSIGKDTLVGGGGADTIVGGAGKDQLTGGAAADRFVFNTALGKSNVDTVTSFTHDLDVIALDDAIFAKIGPVLQKAKFFAATGATEAHDKDDRIVYDKKTGKLFYDDDGNKAGGHAAIHFATLANKPVLDHGDFIIV